MKAKHFILTFVFFLYPYFALSQGTFQFVVTDPAFLALIEANTTAKTKTLAATDALLIERADALHQMDKVFDYCSELEEEFNNYLSSFHEIVVFAAQTYGFYLEFQDISKSFKMITKEIKDHPKNVVAVAIDANRNKIIRKFITRSADIVTDISDICFGKMTASDRLQAVYAIRPKLALLSRDMRDLARVIRYTTMLDAWYDLTGQIPAKKDKADIARESMERWTIQVAKMEPITTGK